MIIPVIDTRELPPVGRSCLSSRLKRTQDTGPTLPLSELQMQNLAGGKASAYPLHRPEVSFSPCPLLLLSDTLASRAVGFLNMTSGKRKERDGGAYQKPRYAASQPGREPLRPPPS